MIYQVEDIPTADLAEAADLFGGLDIEPGWEYSDAGPQQLLVRAAEFVAPIDERPEGLLPGYRSPASACKNVEATVEPLNKLNDGHGTQPGGRQFDGERDPVEPLAQLGGRGP